MKMIPKAVKSAKELKGGCWYFLVECIKNLRIGLVFKVLGKPYHVDLGSGSCLHKAVFIKILNKNPDSIIGNHISLTDSGIPTKYNFHKTFEYNTRNIKFIKSLVEKNNVDGYKRLFFKKEEIDKIWIR